MKTYKGRILTGMWIATLKLDGVQVNVAGTMATSRTGKPLYHVPTDVLADGTYECFCGNWETTVGALRTINGADLSPDMFFSLDPLSARLILGSVTTPQDIDRWFRYALRRGYEGLVLHGPDKQMLKVKPIETHDVCVLGIIPGRGKHAGRMGALITPMGNIGTGFTDAAREECWTVGEIIEVSAMATTKTGKLRHPKFVRRRFDK